MDRGVRAVGAAPDCPERSPPPWRGETGMDRAEESAPPTSGPRQSTTTNMGEFQ